MTKTLNVETAAQRAARLQESPDHYWRCLAVMPSGNVCLRGQAHGGRCSAKAAK